MTPMSPGAVIGDASVIHPAAPSFARSAPTTTGSAARNWDALEPRALRLVGLGGGYELVPVFVGSCEWLGVPAFALCRVTDVSADAVSKATFIESALQKMSVTLCKWNARSAFAGPSSQWPRVPGAVASPMCLGSEVIGLEG
jgi:hypothetical protein